MLISVVSNTSYATAEPSSSTSSEEVEEIVVYGEQRPAMDTLSGATTTRIETDERLLEGAGIDDLLAETPGVQIRRFGGLGESFEISIRGSRPEQVPVYLDGFRLDTSLTGRSDLSTLCLDVLEEIQVTRGAGAARSGSGAIGGVVNLVSRRPGPDPETRVRAGAGNFGTFQGSLRHARKIGPWDVSLGYCGFRTRGNFKYQQIGSSTAPSPILRRANNEAKRHTGLFRVGRKVGRGSIRLTQFTSYLNRGSPGLGIVATQRGFAKEQNLSTLTALAFEHPIEALPQGRIDLGLSHRYERNRFRDPEAQIGADPINTQTKVQGLIGTASLQMKKKALAGQHTFTFLAEGRFDARESNQASRQTRRSIALRAELESRWWHDRIGITPSLRIERYSGLDLEWLPSLAIQVEALEDVTLRGSISRSYRAPSFQELYLPDKGFESGNKNLQPEQAWSFEVGTSITSPFESRWLDFEIDATYFQGEIDQSISFQLVSPTKRSYVNTGPATTRGYELTLRWRPHDWMRLTTSRTVTRTRSKATHCALPGIAAAQTDGRVELGPRKRFKVVAEIHYTGQIHLDSGCGSFLPSRISYDASAALNLKTLPIPGFDRLGEAVWLSVRGSNLGNVAQYDIYASPRPGRNFSVSLEGVF